MMLFVVGVVDVGASIEQRMVLAQAARAAGQYAAVFPNQTAGINSAIGKALPTGWTDVTSTVTPCICAQNPSGAACGTVCTGGRGSYVIVQLQRPYTPFLFPTGNCGTHDHPANCVAYVVRFQ
jgi:hypothetical protein